MYFVSIKVQNNLRFRVLLHCHKAEKKNPTLSCPPPHLWDAQIWSSKSQFSKRVSDMFITDQNLGKHGIFTWIFLGWHIWVNVIIITIALWHDWVAMAKVRVVLIRYNGTRDKHSRTFWTFALTLNWANQSFENTITTLILTYRYMNFDCKMLSNSGNIDCKNA